VCRNGDARLNLQLMPDLSKAPLELSKAIEREVEVYAGA